MLGICKLSHETFSCWLGWKYTAMLRLSCGSLAFHIQAWAELGWAHVCKKLGKKEEKGFLCKSYKHQGNVCVWGTASGLFFHHLPIIKEKNTNFPCLLLRCFVWKKGSILHGLYVFGSKVNLVSTATIISAANGTSLTAVLPFSLHNSLNLVVCCYPTKLTMGKNVQIRHFYSIDI